jgi:hypothetical protein
MPAAKPPLSDAEVVRILRILAPLAGDRALARDLSGVIRRYQVCLITGEKS